MEVNYFPLAERSVEVRQELVPEFLGDQEKLLSREHREGENEKKFPLRGTTTCECSFKLRALHIPAPPADRWTDSWNPDVQSQSHCKCNLHSLTWSAVLAKAKLLSTNP